MYTEEDNVSKEEDRSDFQRNVLFMVLVQDENSYGGKLWVRVALANTSKSSKKWTYNGIHLPSPKSEEMKKIKQHKIIIQIGEYYQK